MVHVDFPVLEIFGPTTFKLDKKDGKNQKEKMAGKKTTTTKMEGRGN